MQTIGKRTQKTRDWTPLRMGMNTDAPEGLEVPVPQYVNIILVCQKRKY